MGDFNTSLTPMDRSSKQKINKETQALNDTIDQIDFIETRKDTTLIKGSIQEEDITIINIINYKYVCTQHRSTSIHKATANSSKRGNRQ